MAFDSIPMRLQAQGRDRPDATAYLVLRDGAWQRTSWRDYAAEVRTAARALAALGVGVGDTVCILGFNRPSWSIFDLAAMSLGAAPAGIYTTCSPEEVGYVIGHAAAAVVLVEDAGQLAKVLAQQPNLPALRHVVLMDGAPLPAEASGAAVPVLLWQAFLARAGEVDEAVVLAAIEALEPDALATLIYTSGTTGAPKGVMLSHRNLAWTAKLAGQVVDIRPDDRAVSYLPLSHIAEQIFTLHGPATYGLQVWYAPSLERVAETFVQARPTILFVVPRIWEKMHAGIRQRLREVGPVKRRLFAWAAAVGRAIAAAENEGREPSPALAVQARLAERLVFSKVKAAIGLDRVRFAISGAAPIAADVLEFLAGIGVVIREVYGQSEGSGPTSFNRPGRTRFGSVGPAIPGVEVRIAADGEVELRGPNVFLGYYKDLEATAEALDREGWLRSGDLGRFDDDGYLHITGRKKEILITAGGKNIAPKHIEGLLKEDALVGEAVVIGDRRKYLTALLFLEPQAAETFASAHGIAGQGEALAAAVAADAQARAQLQAHIDACNARLARVEHVRRFALLSRPLAVEAGELTPTLKVKRRVVTERYAREIEAMYAEDDDGGIRAVF